MRALLEDKTAIVTGASKGIGLAIAELFAEVGANDPPPPAAHPSERPLQRDPASASQRGIRYDTPYMKHERSHSMTTWTRRSRTVRRRPPRRRGALAALSCDHRHRSARVANRRAYSAVAALAAIRAPSVPWTCSASRRIRASDGVFGSAL